MYDLDEEISQESNSEIRRVIRPNLYDTDTGISENSNSEVRAVQILSSYDNLTTEDFDELFPIIPASTLSLDDDFFKWKSYISVFSELQNYLKDGILNGKLKDFRRPLMDPSLDNFENIIFQRNALPFTFKSYNFDFYYVKNKIETFMPSKNSRIGNKLEYYAFSAFLIKYLVENEKYSPDEAISLVCYDSTKLTYDFHPLVSDPRRTTGKVKIWNFYDLGGGTSKLLYDNNSCYYASQAYMPHVNTRIIIANIYTYHSSAEYSVPWIVMDV